MTVSHEDYQYQREHERTYRGFVRGALIVLVASAILLAGMAIFLV